MRRLLYINCLKIRLVISYGQIPDYYWYYLTHYGAALALVAQTKIG